MTALLVFILVGLLGFSAWRVVLAMAAFREWQEWRVKDPSGAELYDLEVKFNVALILIALGVAVFIFFRLRRVLAARRNALPGVAS